MTMSDDLLDRLKADLEQHRNPVGPGPDVTSINRRGTARRRRRRAGVVGGTLVTLGAGLFVGPLLGPQPDDHAPAALSAATAPDTSDHTEVQAVMESALDSAGIEHVGAQLQGPTSGDDGSLRGYILSWTLPAADGGAEYQAEFSVYPDMVAGDANNAPWVPECERSPSLSEQRACVVTRSNDGATWSEHYEAFEQGWWEDTLRTNEWQPRATAAHADGTAVTLNVRRTYGPGPAVAATDVTTYAAPIQAAQLAEAAAAPQLTRIGLP